MGSDDIKVSRFISLILRHKPDEIGIKLDRYGWANVDELIAGLNRKGYAINRLDLDRIVGEDDKNRYSYSIDSTKIRANQGHSIDVDLQMKEVIPPQILYHGTGEKYLASICEGGIVKKDRQYVHLSSSYETAVSVGSRHGKAIVMEVDTEQMYLDGCVFYRSENGVYLTEYVARGYIKVIIG